MPRTRTVGDLRVGTVFRKWDGAICRLVEKTGGRCCVEYRGGTVIDVAYGCEIIEELPSSMFEEGGSEMAQAKTDKGGHFAGPVMLTICQMPGGCGEKLKAGKPVFEFPEECFECRGPMKLEKIGMDNGTVHLTFRDGILVGIQNEVATAKETAAMAEKAEEAAEKAAEVAKEAAATAKEVAASEKRVRDKPKDKKAKPSGKGGTKALPKKDS